jgi:endonuclease/exonuclease/phosphatase family metal-dependent hydrolase
MGLVAELSGRARTLTPVAVFLVLCAAGAAAASDVLAKRAPDLVRVMTWNVAKDSIFPDAPADANRHEPFARVLASLQPDVACLQEVYRPGEQAAALFDAIVPLPEGRRWRQHQVLDNVIVSRLPLERTDGDTLDTVAGRKRGHAMALAVGVDRAPIQVICAHFESRSDDDRVAARERQADLIGERLVAFKREGGLPERTPIVVLGDLNAIASLAPRFLENLMQGRIRGAGPAPGRGPDWDGSALEDAAPLHNGRGEDRWTWRWDSSGFRPGALDRILYTDSVMKVDRAFVLDTTQLSEDELRATGLRRGDTMASEARDIHDHLPVVADFDLSR